MALISTSALAQDGAGAADREGADEEDSVIIVTGTSIRGVAPVGAPVLGIGQEEIQLQPTSTTTELLRQVPAVLGLGASENYGGEANNANANITGGNGVNLRGLGTAATLTLLNGRRLPASGVQGQYFDPSIFATTAIGRMEVMADGGSAIYGSDAVGGVINIFTRRNFDGLEAYVRQGFADSVESTQAGAVAGTRWSSGGAMIAYEYQVRDALQASDRSLYTDDLTAFGGSDLRLTTSSPGNISIGGVLYPIPAGQDGTGLAPSDLQPASANNPANLESRYKYATAIPGQERHSVLGRIDQDLAPGLTAWVEGFYAHRQLEESIGAVTTTLTVPETNAFFVAPEGAVLSPCSSRVGAPAGTLCESILYSFSEDLGPRVRDAFSEVYQVAGGIDADIDDNWAVSAYVSYGQDIESRTQYTINNNQLALALLDSDPATAFNPFGDQGATNPDTLARIRGAQTVATRAQLTDFNLKVDGSLFQIPGGDVRIAVGGEYQIHDWRYQVLDSSRTPDVSTSTETLSLSQRKVKSVFAEAFVPLVGGANAMPVVEELSLSAAVRYDDYSDFGSTTNPKFALNYVPVDGLTLRGTYGTSFRAPTLSDIDPANIVIFAENFVDPTSPSGTTRTLFVRGSNTTDLGPEEATVWSLGADFEPNALPGLSMSLTYFNVDYKGRIESPGADRSALTSALEPLLGELVTRNPSTEQVLFFMNSDGYLSPPEDPANIMAIVDGRKVNVGRLKTDGLEGSIQYRTDVADGMLSAGMIGSYVLNFKRAIFPNEPITDVVNTFGNPVQFRMRGNLGYTTESYSAVAYVNHSGSYINDTVTPSVETPSYTTFDVALRYRLQPNLFSLNEVELSLDVQNLFDRNPPIVLTPTPLPYDGQVSDLFGRWVKVGLRIKM
jgi:iron complex outermembrane receptor protein